MAIYFFISTSSDYHVFSEALANADSLETHVDFVENFDTHASKLGATDILATRNLGGMSFQKSTLEKMGKLARDQKIPFLCLPGYKNDDPSALALSTVPSSVCKQVLEFYETCNAVNILESAKYLSDLYGGTALGWKEPETFPEFGILPGYEGIRQKTTAELNGSPIIAVLFYRTHYLANDYEPVSAVVAEIEKSGAIPLPVYCASMKQPKEEIHPVELLLKNDNGGLLPHAIVDCLSYAAVDISTEGNVTEAAIDDGNLFIRLDRPVIHTLYSSESRQNWTENPKGMTPNDMAMKVVLPEFDGKIIGHPIGFAEETITNNKKLVQYKGDPERIERVVALANKFCNLALKPNKDKKIAIILTNYPTQNARIGNAVGLDTPESLVIALRELKADGYHVENIPESGDDLIHSLIEQISYDTEFLTEEQIRLAPAQIDESEYEPWFKDFPQKNQTDMQRDWGQPPGKVFWHEGKLFFPGLFFGNVFVGIQPPRGFGDNPVAIYHSPEVVPTHHYLAFYRWIRYGFQADAAIHMGKHGNLEWLPGKAVALSENCYPDLAIYDIPFFYYFIVNNPGEGSQAKRRTHSVLIDHMVPPMTRADLYDDLARIEQLIEEWTFVQDVDPDKVPIVQNQIWELCETNNVNTDLGFDEPPENFKEYRKAINGFLCEIGNTQIREGLHVLGKIPKDDSLIELFVSLARIDNPPHKGTQTLFMSACGIEESSYFNDQSAVLNCKIPESIIQYYKKPIQSRGDLLECFDRISFDFFDLCLKKELTKPNEIEEAIFKHSNCRFDDLGETLSYIFNVIYPRLLRISEELTSLTRGLSGKFVHPGPSGAPTRGMASILPTGRNFYSVDMHSLPTTISWIMGQKLGQNLIDRYHEENGQYPETIALVLWGTSNMRTKGDDVAQILFLLGMRPIWKPENKRVIGVEPIPLEELGRPRVDVCARISGFFRDAFPNLVSLMDQAINLAAELDEPPEMNFVRKHYLESNKKPLYRIFGSAPGRYGTGILETIHSKKWETGKDLAEVFLNWGGFAYTRKEYGAAKKEEFMRQLSQTDAASQNQDNREHDIFDSDDYLQFHGGLINAINTIKDAQGKGKVTEYFGDSSNPAAVKIKTLKEEVRRVFRARVVNPKWIDSMKDHGYKGGLEMAATVDYMFGYDATTDVIDDYMYEDVSEKYLLDKETQEFLKEKNPWAIRSMGERLMEAANRGMWKNPDPELMIEIESLVSSTEGDIEEKL